MELPSSERAHEPRKCVRFQKYTRISRDRDDTDDDDDDAARHLISCVRRLECVGAFTKCANNQRTFSECLRAVSRLQNVRVCAADVDLYVLLRRRRRRCRHINILSLVAQFV